jgi:hypothetical protein
MGIARGVAEPEERLASAVPELGAEAVENPQTKIDQVHATSTSQP